MWGDLSAVEHSAFCHQARNSVVKTALMGAKRNSSTHASPLCEVLRLERSYCSHVPLVDVVLRVLSVQIPQNICRIHQRLWFELLKSFTYERLSSVGSRSRSIQIR